MFESIRAIPRAKKLTNSVLSLNSAVVNQLILTGHRLVLEDTVAILQRSLTLLLFTYAAANPQWNRGVWSWIERVTTENIVAWLSSNYRNLGLVGDNTDSIREIVDCFPESVKSFQFGLFEEYPELIGKGVEPWLSVAVLEYSDELSLYISENFDQCPERRTQPTPIDPNERATTIRELARQHVEALTGVSLTKDESF